MYLPYYGRLSIMSTPAPNRSITVTKTEDLARPLALARSAALADSTVSGVTLVLPNGDQRFVPRETERADA